MKTSIFERFIVILSIEDLCVSIHPSLYGIKTVVIKLERL